MNALLVRVGADTSAGGGSWNGPVDSRTGEFAYVPIPESGSFHPGLEKPYALLVPALRRFQVRIPAKLGRKNMHLDPDFEHLTYGDQGERAKQLRSHLGPGDLVVFYAGLKDIHGAKRLVYAIIGYFTVEKLTLATAIPWSKRDTNAHSRRMLTDGSDDTVVHGRLGTSGRLRRCLPIGDWRNGAYRVRRDLLDQWGGLSVKNGWLQRSARLPRFQDPKRFVDWLKSQNPELMQVNN